MNLKFDIDSNMKFYRYSDYQTRQVEERIYIFPKDNAILLETNISECAQSIIIDLLEVGKAVHFKKKNEHELMMEFVKKYGFFGFLNDLPINPLYIMDEECVIKENILINEAILKFDIISYIRKFMPNLLNQDILDKINACKDNLKVNRVSENFKLIFDMHFIYSHDYGEPIDMMLEYARQIFEDLYNLQYSDESKVEIEFVNAKFTNLNRKLILESNTLKNVIDVCFTAEIISEYRKLKLCRHCFKPFIAKNAKSEYDSIKCKNKENVYKFREKHK